MFSWNKMYNYLIEQWKHMDHSLLFKEQFYDPNVSISEYIDQDHLILVKYLGK